MKRKGQVTIFIIFAILIVAGTISYFVFRDSFQKEANIPEATTLEIFVRDCINSQLPSAVQYIGLRGGYNILPEEKILLDSLEVAYGYDLGKNSLISFSEMEFQISSYLEEVLPLCVDEMAFPELVIETKNPLVKTTIQKKKVLVDVNYPLVVTQGDSTLIIENFKAEVFVALGEMYGVANNIVGEKLDSYYMDLNYLSELDYNLEIFPVGNGVFIYSIIDENSKLEGGKFIFNFAVQK